MLGIAQCDSINGQSFKSKKILGTKAGTYESLKSQPLVSITLDRKRRRIQALTEDTAWNMINL